MKHHVMCHGTCSMRRVFRLQLQAAVENSSYRGFNDQRHLFHTQDNACCWFRGLERARDPSAVLVQLAAAALPGPATR
jgi:hypothetical protein